MPPVRPNGTGRLSNLFLKVPRNSWQLVGVIGARRLFASTATALTLNRHTLLQRTSTHAFVDCCGQQNLDTSLGLSGH